VKICLKVILKIKKLENEAILDFLIPRSKGKNSKNHQISIFGFHFVAQNIEE
jgi:hypothetical protein